MKRFFLRSLIIITFFMLIGELHGIKPKIIILTSRGGGGHMSAAQAISDALMDKYNIEIVNPFTDVLVSIDPVKKITFNRYAAEDLYNIFLRNHWNWLINRFFGDFGEYYVRTHRRRIKNCFEQFIKKNSPDLIISVVPYINDVVLEVAEKFNLPFLIVPTDLDVSTFILGINYPKYKNFSIALAFDEPILNKKFTANNVPKDKIQFIGYPLRSSFFSNNFNASGIKKDFHITENKTVVMILMGATGSSAIYKYITILAKCKLDIHLIICLGKNKEIEKKINKIKFPTNITRSVLGYTSRTAELMFISDVLISKSGTATLSEAIQMNLPIFVDNTSVPLQWEKMSCDFIKEHKLGGIIKRFNHVNEMLEKLIKDTDSRDLIKSRMNKFKNESFKKSIRLLINDMFKKSNAKNNLLFFYTYSNLCKKIKSDGKERKIEAALG